MNSRADVMLFRIVVIMLFIFLAIIIPWRQKIEIPPKDIATDTAGPIIVVQPPPLTAEEPQQPKKKKNRRRSSIACSEDSDCSVCSSCSSCKHCSKEGGKCGVCE